MGCLVVALGLSTCGTRAQYLWHLGSVLVAHGLRSLAACGILAPQLGIEPVPLALEAWSLNHWTTREVHLQCLTPSAEPLGPHLGPPDDHTFRQYPLPKIT